MAKWWWFGVALIGCSSNDEFEPWALETLPADQGFSLRVPEIEVPAGREDQSCFFVRVPDLADGEDFWVNRIHLAMNPGSHHMNVFRVKTILGLRPEDGTPIKMGEWEGTAIYGSDEYATHPCWNSAFWADWPLVANTQNSEPNNPYTDWTLPENVAHRFSPGEMLMIQTHYVNTEAQPAPYGGKVGINFHRVPATSALMELGTLFATQQSLRICRSNPEPTFSGVCRFPRGSLTITAANGHFHSRGHRFSMYAWDGRSAEQPAESELFYMSERWDEPPMARDLAVHPPEGGGIWWNCEYRWHEPLFGCETVDAKDPQQQGDCCYTFGGNTDVGEHCNVFAYYYPRVEATDVFCN